jgi:hypothetical protein
VIVKNCATSNNESRTRRTILPTLQALIARIRNEAFRGAKSIDRCLDAFYLPVQAHEQKKKCRPDEFDAIRLHALGVRW